MVGAQSQGGAVGYFWMVLGLAVVVAPLWAVVPSKRQRFLARLRDQALSMGLHISETPLPKIPPRLQRADDRPLVAYWWRLSREQGRGVTAELIVRTREGWETESGNDAPLVLEQLPCGVDVVTVAADRIVCYWDERGMEMDLSSIKSVLLSLAGSASQA